MLKKPQTIQKTKPVKRKSLGQHFLRNKKVVDNMIDKVKIDKKTSVLEIGCGDGFLTESILLQTKCKQLWCYEIDQQWASFTKNKITDPRLKIIRQNILEVNLKNLEKEKPWVLLANLPYQITFPILFLILENKNIFTEGVVMMQEEVAQKIVVKKGKSYSATSMYLQYHFDFELMDKINPGSFSPPPKVHSRLIYFKPKNTLKKTPQEKEFWKFAKLCFKRPRRTLKNNLAPTHYDTSKISQETLKLRAQQLSFDDFLKIWEKLS
jgi:16S rRNA (adenine1518-N6/adenine1519-N6)-dimethyltransferase